MNFTTDRVFRFTVIAVLFAFAGIGIAAAQDTEPAEPAPVDTAAWISWMSESFSVEAAILQSYVEDGYRVMDLRFALELSVASGRTLDEVLEIAEGTTGRGWGVIAQALGVDPGSEAFHALREAHRPGPEQADALGLDMAMEQNRWRNREREGTAQFQGREPPAAGEGQGNRQGSGGNPDRGGPGGSGGPGGKGGSGSKGGSGGQGGR